MLKWVYLFSKKYNIPSKYIIRKWVNVYNGFGDEVSYQMITKSP